MGVKEWLIDKLEKQVTIKGSNVVDLCSLDKKEREDFFETIRKQEQSDELVTFLKIAFKHNAPSYHCCSGHGKWGGAVGLLVNDENIEELKRLGKVLSCYSVGTYFYDHPIMGRTVVYTGSKESMENNWFKIATEVLEEPTSYKNEEENPNIVCYDSEMHKGRKPFAFGLKTKLLALLKKDKTQKKLSELNCTENHTNKSKESKLYSWTLTEEQKRKLKEITNFEERETNANNKKDNEKSI